MAESRVHTVKMDKLVYGGEAMGRLPDGRAIFVPFALPGETVSTRLVVDKRGFARGELLEVLEPSRLRIDPPCEHFSVCGGCHYQHLSYKDQLAAKSEILKDQLTRLGGFNAPPVENCLPSPSEWNYRNQMRFRQDPTGKLGYSAMGSKQIIPIKECFLPLPSLNEFWPALEFPPLPDLAGVNLSVGDEGDLMMVLESKKDEAFELEVDFPIKIVQIGPEAVHVMADTYYSETTILEKAFRHSVGSYLRSNIPVTELMIEQLLANLPLSEDTMLLEVYSGIGVLSAFLAPRVDRLICVEANPGAVSDFIINMEEVDNVEIYEDLAENVLPRVDIEVDIALLDPPQKGLGTKVMDALVSLSPERIVYISSDPATLARDGKRLSKGGYRLKKVTPFDLLPQTSQIDSISIWEKEKQ